MVLRKRLLWILGCAALAAVSWASPQQFDPESYLRHVKYLAGDELKGRANGTPELDRAADYIAEQLRASGLAPAGDHATFFQKLSLTTGSELGPNNKLTIRLNSRSVPAALRGDFIPIAMGDKNSIEGPLVFAGYGITADEFSYDDYKSLDVTDKVVLVLAHEPRENDDQSPFNGRQLTVHGTDNSKVINAKYRQARAILIAQDPANHPDAQNDLLIPGLGEQVDDLGIPALRISRDLAQKIMDSEKKNLLELQKQIDEQVSPASFTFGAASVQIQLDIKRVRSEVRNVAGLLPGTDPRLADETVILGAHYDHLGRGGRSSMEPQSIGQIHNGADDNASGVAGLIELAAKLSRPAAPRRRSYLFIAFAGEELGLHGSGFWTNHPGRSLEKVVAMLNMDMIGRSSDDVILLSGAGTSPDFPKLAEQASAQAGLKVKPSPSGYGSSDHQSFYLKKIPVLFFFSGLHADYHRPSDDWDKINAAGATRILEMIYAIATQLNVMDSRPQFTQVAEPATMPITGSGGGYGAYFGSVPDMTGEVDGVRFSDVRPGSPAAKAGLRGQDVLVRFAGKEVKNLQDFTYLLRTHKPGETVEVVVLREGQPVTVQVTLGIRR